jgi:Xaa-Pro dipeptidase
MDQLAGNDARAALLDLPRRLGLDAVVAMSPENFAYASGVHVITVNLIRPRQAFVILPARSEPEVIVCSIERPVTVADSWISHVETYTEFTDDPVEKLAERLRELGLEHGRIGMDLDFLPVSSHTRLMRKLGNLELVNTTEEIAAIRAVKTRQEIALIRRAACGTHRAALDAMRDSKPGETEQQMCMRIANGIMASGATAIAFLCFASGERTAMSHAMATDKPVLDGEIIRFDIGGVYGSYYSDFARTYSTGNPSAIQRQTYAALHNVQRATIDAVQPGMAAEDLFFLCRDKFHKAGLRFTMPHIGHSFGVELHETPMLRPGEKTKLRPGMVFNIEPITVDDAGSKYHLEDLLEVTETGYRLMTLGLAPAEIPVLGEDVPIAVDFP